MQNKKWTLGWGIKHLLHGSNISTVIRKIKQHRYKKRRKPLTLEEIERGMAAMVRPMLRNYMPKIKPLDLGLEQDTLGLLDKLNLSYMESIYKTGCPKELLGLSDESKKLSYATPKYKDICSETLLKFNERFL